MANERPSVVQRPGGIVLPGDIARPRTGGWRTGVKPAVDLTLCVDCLLCWIHCPDMAVQQRGGVFQGFDYDLCKGCEICSEVCPTSAIEMVPEATEVSALGVLAGKGGRRDG
jgi:2-oxoacid:acceptor oxidoreductase delta subunit (pyruvate/2-ketoisovalerate family)